MECPCPALDAVACQGLDVLVDRKEVEMDNVAEAEEDDTEAEEDDTEAEEDDTEAALD